MRLFEKQEKSKFKACKTFFFDLSGGEDTQYWGVTTPFRRKWHNSATIH